MPGARMIESGIRSRPMRKFSRARSVCAPPVIGGKPDRTEAVGFHARGT
jgi:hypothetical protein